MTPFTPKFTKEELISNSYTSLHESLYAQELSQELLRAYKHIEHLQIAMGYCSGSCHVALETLEKEDL